MIDFEAAKDKVLMGAERRSLIMSDEDKRVTAFHEAGHALVAMLSSDSDPDASTAAWWCRGPTCAAASRS